MTHHNLGFSLLELIITLVVIAILFAIAIPKYDHHITKSKRLHAEATLMELAAKMERRYLQDRTYALATIGLNPETDILSSPFDANKNYEFKIMQQTEQSYVLAAKPLGTQAKNDVTCGTLQLDHLARRIATGSAGAKACWG